MNDKTMPEIINLMDKHYAEIMPHIGVIEMVLTLLLSTKQIPDDLRENVLKALSDMTITAMSAAELE